MKRNVIQISGGMTINLDVSIKNVMYVKKDYVWNPSTCNCENGKYLAIIMDDLAIMCDEIIESYHNETKTIPTNFNEEKTTWKRQNFNILPAFLLIAIALLIAISFYCDLIKYRTKQKHLVREILQ